MRLLLVSFVIVAAISAPVHAAPPTLLADFNSPARAQSSYPGGVSWIGGSSVPETFALIFTGLNASRPVQRTVWISDGTNAGTRSVAGLPTIFRVGTDPPPIAARSTSGAVVLSFPRPNIGNALYGLDIAGSHATLLVEGAGADGLAPVGDRFVFTYDDGVHGRELWSTDGTPAGTALLWEFAPGPGDAEPVVIASDGALAWVSAKSPTDPAGQLFVTDGAVAGTRAIGSAHPGFTDGTIRAGVAVAGGVLYTAQEPTGVNRAYFATPTTGPSAPLSSSGGELSYVNIQFSAGPHAMITAIAPGSSFSVYRTDGTITVPISASLMPSVQSASILPDPTAPFGWVAVFNGYRNEPWRSDGTSEGTYILADLVPGIDPSDPAGFVSAGSRAYFSASAQVGGALFFGGRLITSDGTGTGTVDLGAPAGVSAWIQPVAVVGERVLCRALDQLGVELWAYDTASMTFSFIRDLDARQTSGSAFLVLADSDAAVVGANTPAATSQLFVSHGEPGSVTPVISPAHAPISASTTTPSMRLGRFGDDFALLVTDGSTGDEPWLIDRSSGSATLIRDIRTGSPGSLPLGQVDYSLSFTPARLGDAPNQRIVFAAASSSNSSATAVWSTDGTTGNTIELSQHRHYAGGRATVLFNFTPLGGSAYYFATSLVTESSSALDLWTTDGTVAGTRRAVPFEPLGLSSINPPTGLAAWNGRVYFFANNTYVPDGRLFSSDGTPEGTRLANLGPVAGGLRVSAIYPSSFGLLVVGADADSRVTLWVTDDTPQGTRLLTDDSSDARYSNISGMREANGRVYFAMWSRAAGRELWVTDGTAASTRPVADLIPGPGSSDPQILHNTGDGRVLFSAYTPARGIELWQSDGTPGGFGTRLIADLNPGPDSSGPTEAALIGPNLVFNADDGSSVGRELWTVPLGAPCRCDIDNSGGTSVQDIFDFLSLYFFGRGDFNGDGATGVQDIFDFLGCWFVGCD